MMEMDAQLALVQEIIVIIVLVVLHKQAVMMYLVIMDPAVIITFAKLPQTFAT
jgi:hypothetical protein